jgi:hypothetical protein
VGEPPRDLELISGDQPLAVRIDKMLHDLEV